MQPENQGANGTDPLRMAFRRQMPIAQSYAYFDHAAVAPLPEPTSKRINEFLYQATHQGDVRWPEWAAAAEQTRKTAAKLVGCERSEIALIPNTTFGISVIAEGLPWSPGDNVVVPANEFPSNLVPWRNLARRGVQVRLVPVGEAGAFSAQDIERLIDDRTRLVSVSWVGFYTGFRCPIQEIVELAHGYRCLVFLDAIQGLGAFPLDVQKVPVDFLAADGHKWMLGPEGAGLLYIREQHLDSLQPLQVGWNSLRSNGFDSSSVELKHSAARYEGGSYNMLGMAGFGASLELLMELGCNRTESLVEACILENVAELEKELLSAGFLVDLPRNPAHRSGILGIRWDQADESNYLQARKHLLEHNIVTSVRGGRLRVATHAYNDRQDRQQLVSALVDFRGQPKVPA